MASTSLLALALLIAPLEFPMETDGMLDAHSFFQQDIAHYIFGSIGVDITVLRIGDFSWGIGHQFDTFMGVNWNNPVMLFNLYGGHWRLSTQFGYRLEPVLLRLYSDHECFHNIDQSDTLSEYMNNLKLGVVLEDPPPEFSEGFEPLPSGWPDGWLSLGVYTPTGPSFQQGHDFDWSMHGETDLRGVGFRDWTAGLRYHLDLYFHESGDVTNRQWMELYTHYEAPFGAFEAYLTDYLSDTQPFRSLAGRSFWGVRFLW